MKLREEEFYEQYHQHGGTTIIPTEIFNEIYDDATEEIERQKELIKQLDIKNLELTTIIKEVREYITKQVHRNQQFYEMDIENILEILDKENNKTKEVMSVEELEEYEPKNMVELEYQEWFWD